MRFAKDLVDKREIGLVLAKSWDALKHIPNVDIDFILILSNRLLYSLAKWDIMYVIYWNCRWRVGRAETIFHHTYSDGCNRFTHICCLLSTWSHVCDVSHNIWDSLMCLILVNTVAFPYIIQYFTTKDNSWRAVWNIR